MVAEKVTAIAEAQAAAVTKMIMGGGMAAAICFRCLFAEGSGKPTSPYPTLISYAPGVLHAHRQRWYETTPGGVANEKRVPRRAWNLTGTSGYARMIDAARLIESRF